MTFPSFLASEQENQAPDTACFHVIPAPFEASVSYGSGTARGPGAILEASQQLESWDGSSIPLEMGIHTTQPVDCAGDAPDVLDRIRTRVGRTLSKGALPVLLGGEHTVTLGALRALKKKQGPGFGIVQFDAHADLRDQYLEDRFSHACVMRRALEEICGPDASPPPLFQIGVRALCKEEHDLRVARGIGRLDPGTVFEGGIPDQVLPPDFPPKVYITFDVDGLDPSVISSTGTPVPGGINWFQAMALLENIIQTRQVIGFDVVELAPQKGGHASDFAAAQLVYNIMGFIQRSNGSFHAR